MINGGHVRVGFEDNVYLARGVLAKSNAELVAKAVRLAKDLGREIAEPEDVRRILQIETR
jgi:3-keto-5-aminohexanoate cleavage enzyme